MTELNSRYDISNINIPMHEQENIIEKNISWERTYHRKEHIIEKNIS